jgi:thiol-disulfide isomerase/thioredoxin
MRWFAVPLFTLSLLTLATLAADKDNPAAPTPSDALQELNKSYSEAQQKYGKELQPKVQALQKEYAQAKDEDKPAIVKKFKELTNHKDSPGAIYCAKFLAWAGENPKDPASMTALQSALQASGGFDAKDPSWSKILDEIRAHHVTDPEIRNVIRQLNDAGFDEASEKLLREIEAKNKDRKIQGFALRKVADGKDQLVSITNELQETPKLREQMEEGLGKEFVARIIADADKNRKEAAEVQKLLADRYGDIIPCIGKPLPEVSGKDLDDKEVKVADLKGKVVVVDIWATWCGPCKAMIPHEKEMVEKLKDKPFALVSISADNTKEDLTKFLSKTEMPWTHWYNGPRGGFVEKWDVEHFPTIFVLDAKGIIRYKEIRGKKLEEAVEKLVKEAEAK